MALLDAFSEREKDVMDLLLQGMSNKQIAHSLGVSTRTVEFHLSNIYLKLGVKSRSEAILIFTQNSFRPGQQIEGAGLREPTVVQGGLTRWIMAEISNLPRRSTMQKKFFIFIAASLLTGILIFPFHFFEFCGERTAPRPRWFLCLRQRQLRHPVPIPSPLTEAVPEQASPGDDLLCLYPDRCFDRGTVVCDLVLYRCKPDASGLPRCVIIPSRRISTPSG